MRASIKNNVLTINTGITKAALKAAASKEGYTLKGEEGEALFRVTTGATGSIDGLGLTANSTAAGELVVVIIGEPAATAEKMKATYGKAIAVAKPLVERIAAELATMAATIDASVVIEEDTVVEEVTE